VSACSAVQALLPLDDRCPVLRQPQSGQVAKTILMVATFSGFVYHVAKATSRPKRDEQSTKRYAGTSSTFEANHNCDDKRDKAQLWSTYMEPPVSTMGLPSHLGRLTFASLYTSSRNLQLPFHARLQLTLRHVSPLPPPPQRQRSHAKADR